MPASPRNFEQRAAGLRSLLKALATGGREPLLELSDWEDYLYDQRSLRHSSVLRWFLMALRHEWQPPSAPTALCAAVTDDVEASLRFQPGPWATVLGHILRVAGYAVWLAEESRIDPEAPYIAALFHDYDKLNEWDKGLSHAELGARHVTRVLAGELPRDVIAAIQDAIAIHPDRPAPSWSVARVLHDADKLDKVGATGLLRRVSKTEDLDDAYTEAERTLDDAEFFPPPCLAATRKLLNAKLAFTRTLGELLY